MSAPPDKYDVENEVAFAALGGWAAALSRALQAYCDHCRRLPPRELARRSRVLIDFDVWVDPQGAANGAPLAGSYALRHAPEGLVEHQAAYLAERIKTGQSDPYAILGALARECER